MCLTSTCLSQDCVCQLNGLKPLVLAKSGRKAMGQTPKWSDGKNQRPQSASCKSMLSVS